MDVKTVESPKVITKIIPHPGNDGKFNFHTVNRLNRWGGGGGRIHCMQYVYERLLKCSDSL